MKGIFRDVFMSDILESEKAIEQRKTILKRIVRWYVCSVVLSIFRGKIGFIYM